MSALAEMPLDALIEAHPGAADFLVSIGLAPPRDTRPVRDWLAWLPDEDLLDAGMERAQILTHLERLIARIGDLERAQGRRVGRLTICGGRDKSGRPEDVEIEVRAGEVLCLVGPTGCGKSRLLADIECLAQGDTPTGRRILLDGAPPEDALRFSLERKPVAQLSQNMNFVVDLGALELIALHARCRMAADPEALAERVVACANALTGEKFAPDTRVTQLSGGQTRALMIADVALLSVSPIVLIDEIENAGVDRKRALDLLVGGEKIVLISTHDPLLALRGDRRVAIRNGGIAEVVATSALERRNLERLESLDAALMDIRERLRRGERIEEWMSWPS